MFESDSHTVNVLPIPPLPDNYPDAFWLPARDVTLNEEWSREPDRIDAGEPVTRRVTISALGQIETQIPAIEPPEIDGMNVYADKPELSRRIEGDGIRGIRKDQYALIGVAGGDVELPAVEVPWWDIASGTWRVASLPSRTVTVRGEPAAAAPREPEIPAESAVEPAPVPALVPGGFWPRASQLLLALWLLTLFAWWWSSRDRRRAPREPAPPPVYKQQAKLVKSARKAAVAGDAAAARKALLDWARLEWPAGAPRSIGELADRLSSPLDDELRRLSSASYGPGERAWDGEALAQSLRSFSVRRDKQSAAQTEPLPPLMPTA